MDKDIVLQLSNEIDKILPSVIKIRHHLHRYPEIALKEFKTADYIRKTLSSLDLTTLKPFLETDVVAFINKQKLNKNITFRADIDALPILEQNDLPYKSVNKNLMHACGHDGHTAILIGTIMVLNKFKEKLNGSVRFVFQPGEEIVAGGAKLVAAGVLKNPEPNLLYALHGFPDLDTGSFSSKNNVITSAADSFKIIIKGKGGHGSTPEKCIDPILTAAKIIEGLNHIVSRKISAQDSAVISVCKVHSGTSSNVIPSTAELEGTVRYFDQEVGKNIPTYIEDVIRGCCESMGANYEFIYEKHYIPMVNSEYAVSFGSEIVKSVFGVENWTEMKTPLMGAEDFAYFIKDYPGAMFSLGLGYNTASIHNSEFDFNDNAIKNGILFFSSLALKYLKDDIF